MTGLRSSLHDLSVAHPGAVAAITKRLDRIEVMVGLATDMTSSISDPAAQKVRRAETAARQAEEADRRPRRPADARDDGARHAASRAPSAGTCSTSSR